MTSRMVRPARVALASAFTALVFAVLAGCSFQPEEKTWEISGPVFGTSYHINVVLTEDPEKLETLASGIDEVLEDVDASMSTWRDDSELSLSTSGTISPNGFPFQPGCLRCSRKPGRSPR